MMEIDRHFDILHRLVGRSPPAVAGVHQIGIEQRLIDPAQIDGTGPCANERREMLDVAQQADCRGRTTGHAVSRHMDAQTGDHILLGQPPRHRIGDAGKVQPIIAIAGVHPENGRAQIPVIVTEAGKLRTVGILPDRNAGEDRLVVAIDGGWPRRPRRQRDRRRHHGAPASGGR
ncbi:hypothetical protein [Bradyrhizobium sp.]|uniref:hypothetical protein n=1 Tax=Bradyrhizobium sp. TaxID=376 RepID=UPI00391B1542